MDNNLPVKFSWGAFCRRVITDKDTGEVSIVDIIPALNLDQVIPLKQDTDKPNISINLGKMYIAALFQRLEEYNDEINEKLSIEFLQSNLQSINIEIDFFIKSKESFTFVNLNLRDLFLTIPSSLSVSDYSFEAIYRIRDQELGRAVLPIKIEFKSLESNE